MISLKDQLIQSCFKNDKFSHNMLRSKTNETLRILLKQKTQFLPEDSSDSQRAWHVYHSIYSYPSCIGGNERRSFHTFEQGYHKTCYMPRHQCSCWDDAKKSSSETMTRTNQSGKIKQSLQERYSVNSPSQIPGVGNMISKSQENLIFGKMRTANLDLEKLKILRSVEWWQQQSGKSVNELAIMLDVANSTIKYFSDKFDSSHLLINKRLSKPEVIVREFLLQTKIPFKRNDKKTIYPLELDFFIPSKSLAIEVNGLYTHSEISGNKNRKYHLHKTEECEKQNITLLQFTDQEIFKKWDLIQSMLHYHLQSKEMVKISGRKCIITDLSNQQTIDFLNTNHLQGFERGVIKKGLIYRRRTGRLYSSI